MQLLSSLGSRSFFNGNLYSVTFLKHLEVLCIMKAWHLYLLWFYICQISREMLEVKNLIGAGFSLVP